MFVVQSLCHVQFFVTPRTDCSPTGSSVHGISQASGLPFPPPGYLPDPGIKPVSPALADGFFTNEPPGQTSSTYKKDHMIFVFLSSYFIQHNAPDIYLCCYKWQDLTHILTIVNDFATNRGTNYCFYFLWINTQKQNCQII